MIVDTLSNWQQYFPKEKPWQVAFDYLLGLTSETEDGYVELQGKDLYARVMSYTTKPRFEGIFEAHRQYLDIQAALTSGEGIEWCPVGALKVHTPYDGEKDFELYHRPETVSAIANMTPGRFALLFPGDAHMPQLVLRERPELVKKVVVKINVGLI